MTNSSSPSDETKVRLTALENGQAHFREIMDLRHTQLVERIATLAAQNEHQNAAMSVLEKRLMTKVDGIYSLLWSGMKWLGTLLGVTLLTIVLKAVGLY